MDLNKLREVLNQNTVIKKETTKNFIVYCKLCGDHPDTRKRGHLYVSKNPDLPVVHCFMCGESLPLIKYIELLTSDKNISKEIISEEELKKAASPGTTKIIESKSKLFKIPIIDLESFPLKRLYIKKRTNNKLNPENIPNLIFNFSEFFSINNLNHIIQRDVGNLISEFLHKKFVGFISKNHTMLYCRCIDETEHYKFRKITLQESKYNLLDYVYIRGNNPNSNTVVLSEGTFDILGEYVEDSLGIKNNVRLYAAGQSYSYSSLLRSISFDESLFKINVIILSDRDKKVQWYQKFIEENDHIIEGIKIFYNKSSGGDFGSYPIRPFNVPIPKPRYKKSQLRTNHKTYK